MLYYESISSEALEFLEEIQKMELFNSLRLVGSPALALQIGYRVSIDFDSAKAFFFETDAQLL